MNYLLDTHILLWYIVGDKRISSDIQANIEKDNNIIFLSNASLWEISIKISIGKLKLKGTLSDLKNKGFKILESDFNDLETLVTLPFLHQDLFDRLIIAQAKTKPLKVLTNNFQVRKYCKMTRCEIQGEMLPEKTIFIRAGLIFSKAVSFLTSTVDN